MTKYISPEEAAKIIGKRGGEVTAKRYSKKKRQEWGALGAKKRAENMANNKDIGQMDKGVS